MKLGVRLCVLVISLQLWALGQRQELEPEQVLVFCDDKDVEAAVDLALVKYNEKLPYGNQLALYQILEASTVGDILRTLLFILSYLSSPFCIHLEFIVLMKRKYEHYYTVTVFIAFLSCRLRVTQALSTLWNSMAGSLTVQQGETKSGETVTTSQLGTR